MGRRKQRKSVEPAAESGALRLGRDAYARRAWHDACGQLARADRAAALGADDLERLALAAYFAGRDEDYLRALERAHRAHLDAGKPAAAVRCAFWLGLRFAFRGEAGPASGWFGRAERLLLREGKPCVEHGYLLLPVVERQLHAGDAENAYLTATRAAELGERFADADLVACARHQQGRALLQMERVVDGLALLDEAMIAVTAGELSLLVTGLIYCGVIETCQRVYAVARAHEWTNALDKWCTGQPQLVSFTGACLVHRAEIMRLKGAWPGAIEEARRACARLTQANNEKGAAAALYQEAEVHRLRGAFAAAERGYRAASERGWDPQPGLALLCLAQGRTDAAAATIRRVTGATDDRLHRVRLLPAQVEILLAANDVPGARRAARELQEIAAGLDADMPRAMAAQAQGAVELAEGDAAGASLSLRRARELWEKVEAPYEAARVRVLTGLACRAAGDDEGAALEWQAARAVFVLLGATPDAERVDAGIGGAQPERSGGLTAREMQVLRLVAAGKTNKAIANELLLREKTIERHVSNIFGKIDVPSRAAATAWAYEHAVMRH